MPPALPHRIVRATRAGRKRPFLAPLDREALLPYAFLEPLSFLEHIKTRQAHGREEASKVNPVKAVFFDVGWTLSYPHQSLWDCFAEVIRERGVETTSEEVEGTVHSVIARHREQAISEFVDGAEYTRFGRGVRSALPGHGPHSCSRNRGWRGTTTLLRETCSNGSGWWRTGRSIRM